MISAPESAPSPTPHCPHNPSNKFPLGQLLPGALSKLDVISAPAFGRMSVMEALRAGLRSAQEKLEGSQKNAFGGAMGRPDKAMVVAGLCPIHGPIVRSATTELIYKYR